MITEIGSSQIHDLLSQPMLFSLEIEKNNWSYSCMRKEEINVHREILRAELRVANEDKHNVTMNLRSREANVEK